MKPRNLPNINRVELITLLQTHCPTFQFNKFVVVGLRGYYKNSMGVPGENDRSIYDDAIVLLTENELHNFNGNCDPSKFETGMAKLKAGIWPVYKFALHRGKYLALCQRAGQVTVHRDEKDDDTGMFGINIHKGGFTSTSSLGCQTIYPTQWDRFIGTAQRICLSLWGEKYKSHTITYILIDL